MASRALDKYLRNEAGEYQAIGNYSSVASNFNTPQDPVKYAIIGRGDEFLTWGE